MYWSFKLGVDPDISIRVDLYLQFWKEGGMVGGGREEGVEVTKWYTCMYTNRHKTINSNLKLTSKQTGQSVFELLSIHYEKSVKRNTCTLEIS